MQGAVLRGGGGRLAGTMHVATRALIAVGGILLIPVAAVLTAGAGQRPSAYMNSAVGRFWKQWPRQAKQAAQPAEHAAAHVAF